MDILGIGALVSKVLDKTVGDASERANAKLKLLEMQQNGELEVIKTQMSAILAEANSSDKWTSRARPSFNYVMYVMILWALPFSIVWAFWPATAQHMADGMKAWLAAIPDQLYTLFGVGFTGYTAGRSWEKVKSASK